MVTLEAFSSNKVVFSDCRINRLWGATIDVSEQLDSIVVDCAKGSHGSCLSSAYQEAVGAMFVPKAMVILPVTSIALRWTTKSSGKPEMCSLWGEYRISWGAGKVMRKSV